MSFAVHGAPLEARLLAGRLIEGECWRWVGSHTLKGYGQLRLGEDGGRKLVPVHRAAYLLWEGEIPEGKEINHTCFVRDCFNPEHLEVVTHAENVAKRSGRPYTLVRPVKPMPTHCLHGHEYTPENTIYYRGKYRTCRQCRYDDINARKRERRKAVNHG